MKKTILFILNTLISFSLYPQEIFHSIATDNGLITDGSAIQNNEIHKDSNYIVFKNGSYGCNQYIQFYKLAADLAKKTNSGLIILFDDNGEDTSFYMQKYYNDPAIQYQGIINRPLYKLMNVPDNSFSAGFIEKGKLYKKINVVLLANIKISNNQIDSIELQNKISDLSDLKLINDSQILIIDPSINQKISLVSLITGKEIYALNLNQTQYSYISDSIYSFLINNKLTDFLIQGFKDSVAFNNKNNPSSSLDSEFKIDEIMSIPYLTSNAVYLPVIFNYYPEKRNLDFLYYFSCLLKLDYSLKIIDYYFFNPSLISLKYEWHISNLSNVKNDTFIFEMQYSGIDTYGTPNYLNKTFGYFKINQNHLIDTVGLSTYRLPYYKPKSYKGFACYSAMTILQDDKVLIQDLPYLYNIHNSQITDTLSKKYTTIENIYRKEVECFTGLEYYSVPSDIKNGYVIYKIEKDNHQLDIFMKDKNQKVSLVFHTIIPKKIFGFYDNTVYFLAVKEIDGRQRKFIYKQFLSEIQ